MSWVLPHLKTKRETLRETLHFRETFCAPHVKHPNAKRPPRETRDGRNLKRKTILRGTLPANAGLSVEELGGWIQDALVVDGDEALVTGNATGLQALVLAPLVDEV